MEVSKKMSVKSRCLITKLRQYLHNKEAKSNKSNEHIPKTQVSWVPEQIRMKLENGFSFTFLVSDLRVATYLDLIIFLHAYHAHGIHFVLVDVFVHFLEVEVSEFKLFHFFFLVEKIIFRVLAISILFYFFVCFGYFFIYFNKIKPAHLLQYLTLFDFL